MTSAPGPGISPLVGAGAFPAHLGPWTLDEALALPEDQGRRIELIDGAVLVRPAPGIRHQRVLQRLQVRLAGAVPPHCELLPGVNVVLGGERLLIPDLVVTTVPGLDAAYCRGTDVLLAAEVLEPSAQALDRLLKPQLYAAAGVPFLLLVDPATSPVSAVAHELRDGGYREVARAVHGRLELALPFPVRAELGS